MDGFLKLRLRDSSFQAKSDLCAWFGVSHIPAFSFSVRLPDPAGCFVIGMHLHGKFFVRE